jgi:hypothetical protein
MQQLQTHTPRAADGIFNKSHWDRARRAAISHVICQIGQTRAQCNIFL